MEPLLRVDHLKKYFPLARGPLTAKHGQVHAVDDVSFTINPGETLGLVGESGCGKTTVGRCLLRLIEPTAGQIRFEGTEIAGLSRMAMKGVRRNMQIIFQDPFGSLPPRMRLRTILTEPQEVHGVGSPPERMEAAMAMLQKVGLSSEHMHRYPHEFSGGQRQRIAIARALMLHPKLVIADEPVSALDVSIRAQILNLMVRLQAEMGLSYLFISHDLSLVKYMSDRIGVMYLGRIVELAGREELYRRPLHPYTEALLSAILEPKIQPKRKGLYLGGEVPSPIAPPSGCHFHPRCPCRAPDCEEIRPELRDAGGGHWVACHPR
jgi:oligopeptide/dipeptide ABC transporter ATP-binding protein